MAFNTLPGRPAIADLNGAVTLIKGGVGKIYAETDTALANPLTVYSLTEQVIPTLNSNSVGMIPDAKVSDQYEAVIWHDPLTDARIWLPTKEAYKGLTAYQVAQKNGFAGTEAQWLESLKEPAETAAAAATAVAQDLEARRAAGEFDGAPGQDGQDGLPGPNAVENDVAFAAALTTPGTATNTAVTATIVSATAGLGNGSVIDPLVSALDMRDPRPLTIAQASDSTGDSFREWFEVSFKELLASKWPERPGRVYTWNKTNELYDGPVTWQAVETPGTSTPTLVGADDFSTDTATVDGMAADVGGPWDVSSLGTWQVIGGSLMQTDPAASGYAWLPLLAHSSIDGTYEVTVTMESTGATQVIEFAPTANGGGSTLNRLSVVVGGSGSMTCTLRKNIGAGDVTMATWPAGTVNVTGGPQTFTITVTIDGLNVTASIGAAQVTGTLESSDLPLIGRNIAQVGINKAAATKLDNLSITSPVTTPPEPSELGYLTAYNAGYAGGRAEHQLARLNSMFPVRPDVLFINHGHNYSLAGQDTPAFFLDALDEFVDAFHAKYPDVPVVCNSQNPEHALAGSARTPAEVSAHAARQYALRAHCIKRGWGYIPGFEAFMAEPDKGYARINADGIHPLVIDINPEPTGARLQIDTAKTWISGQSMRP